MTSSAVTAVMAETDRAAIASVGDDSSSADVLWMRSTARDPAPAWSSPPSGTPEPPRAAPGLGRGTMPEIGDTAARGVGYNVVVGQQAPTRSGATNEPELPYPRRHVHYAEHAAAFLRSIARRDRLFEDVATDPELEARLYKAVDDCAALLEQIRRRKRR